MSLDGLTILLAEDNPTNQMVATQMLESLGAEVVLAADGKEALERLHSDTFDVALIDIEMPRVSGVELIKLLRDEGGRFAALPLIALTAYVMREHREAIEAAGADGIIAKPILSIDEFGRQVRSILDDPPVARSAPPERARPTGDGTAPTMDTETFRALCAAFDPPRRGELLHKVSRDIETACHQITEARPETDHDVVRAASHVLISVAGTIGAERLMSLAKCLNSAGHDEDSRKIERLAPELRSEAGRVLEFIETA